MRRRRLVVVGGGISGLAAAWVAARAGVDLPGGLEVLVLERNTEVGGRSRSLRRDGWLVEAGPGGYLDTEPRLARLVREADLEEERIRARPDASRRFLFHGGALHEIGSNLWKPLRSGLLGPLGALRVLAEPLVRARRGGGEESIYDFSRRRLGRQFAERVVSTAMLGIFAGDARRLSMGACFPELERLEREHGSVIRGALARRRAREEGPEAEEAPRPSRKLTSFRGGLQQLSRKLAAGSGFTVRTDTEVVAIRPAAGAPAASAGDAGEAGPGYAVVVRDGDPVEADAVIVATPVRTSARLLRELSPRSAERLAEVPVPPVAVVGLGFDAAVAAEAFPRGFGMLVARGEGIRMLGCLWETRIYPGRSPDDGFLARAMFGGRVDPASVELDDDELVAVATAELRSILGVAGSPIFAEVVRWPRAIPQYEIGHVGIRDEVERELRALPGVHLAGDALRGVSYPRTAVAGMREGERAVEYLAGRVGR